MHYTRYCRTVLFTPALRQDRYEGALKAGADISLVDLEDSVAPARKDEARRMATAFFALQRPPRPRLAIRINQLCEPAGLADLLAICEWAHKPDIVMIPKVESARDLEIADGVLGPVCPEIHLMVVIETARGLQQADSIAMASRRLKALVFGSADFSFSINSTMDWEALLFARARLVVAARAAGLHAIDTACFAIDDAGRLSEEARRARDVGMSGKAAIHPRQVAAINSVFSPDPAELERARKIVAQAEASQGDICVVEGTMIGIPIVEAARRTLGDFESSPQGTR